ncbi:MAG: acyltransferase [Chlorobi bacterium]|nr:acyltransferase [Chlorobiota bacterium]
MQTIKITDFYDEFRPYNEKEALEAVERIKKNKRFKHIFQYFFPEIKTKNDFEAFFLNIKSIKDFQIKIMHEVAQRIIERTSDGLTVSGIHNIEKNKKYVFISNHRDIILDATFFQYALVDNGFDTTEITFGNNLMEDPLIVDIGKINKMFKVYRKGTPKELLKKTLQLSEYIRYAVLNKHQSVWIAQRGGRTKDGNDKTHSGIIKMLNASGNDSFEENIKALNIVPLSISYEFEPNDALKVKELLNTVNGKYEKAPGEDINSIIDGTCGYKGRIHIAICKPVNNKLETLKKIQKTNDKVTKLGEFIDNEIYDNYKLFPNNYIAYDILNNTNKFSGKYSENEKIKFIKHKENRLKKASINSKKADNLFLKIYANPVKNVHRI